MDSIEDFLDLVRDELGIPVATPEAGTAFDELTGWDSVHLLALATALERETGRRLSLPDVLETTSLAELYQLAASR
ncbi:acyl carrier protein [Parafrankia sp. FMc2]|uniref:acyl carrier protein n=1 Tax=Parafrankia sp. FMc2 TaxID=3233196 RepID=UPI0034D5E240